MLVDLHAKSSASDDMKIDAEEVLKKAKSIGLDGVAFCETLSTATCSDTLDAAERLGVQAFIGVEIPTDKGIIIGFTPEIDEFYFAEEWRQLTEFATPPAHQVVQMFAERGGAVVASRPYDLSIPYNMGDLLFTLENVHAVEVFNTRCDQVQCDFALEAAKFMGVPTTGGTDPKGSGKEMGRYATFFDGAMTTQAQFVTALREDEYWAVQFGHTPKSKSKSKRSGSRGSGGRRGKGRGRGRRGGRGSGKRSGKRGRGRGRKNRD